jgi:hypothetical protein
MFGIKYEGLRKKQTLDKLSDYIMNKQEKIKYPDRSAIEKQMKKSLHYYKRLQDTMDAHETKAQSTHFRRRLLERQKVASYQNELDRLRGGLSQAELKGLTAGAFKSRIEKLEKLTEQIK